jgi:hypothetical protein
VASSLVHRPLRYPLPYLNDLPQSFKQVN